MKAFAPFPSENPIQIRALHPDDLPALLVGCWQDRLPDAAKTTFQHLMAVAATQRDMGFVVVDRPNAILAFGRLTIWLRYAEISDLIVLPERRSQGLGTALIQYLVQVAQSLNLEFVEIGAAVSNTRALALYLRLGFQKALVRYIDLGQGNEAVQYMRLRLPDAGS